MGPLFVILLIVAAWDVARLAVKHTAADYGHSRDSAVREAEKKAGGKTSLPSPKRRSVVRRHKAGYWAGEVLHFFPVLRTGLHAGWLSHRTARTQAKAIREEARTADAETRASFIQGLRAQQGRRHKAFEDIQREVTWDGPVRGKEVDLAAGKVLPFRTRDGAPPLPADAGKPGPGPYAPADPRLNDAQRQRDAKGQRDVCAACGRPGTPADPLVTAEGYRVHRSETSELKDGSRLLGSARRVCSECEGDGRGPHYKGDCPVCEGTGDPPDAEHAMPDPLAGGVAWPAGVPHRRKADQTAPPATNGTTRGEMPMSDTTYRSVLADAKAAHAQADEDTTTIRKRRDDAYALADQMTAANVDPAVIDQQMAYADSLGKALDALTEAGEHAGSTATTAERFHGGVQEAVDSAPGRVAEKSFHEGS